MIHRLFPRTIDNDYSGVSAALWILGFLAVIKLAMGINVIFNGSAVLTKADGVSLTGYPPAAALSILALFALWGWELVLISLLALLTLLRYRAATPLLFVLLLAEHIGRKLILSMLPVARSADAPASSINAVFLVATVIGLILSLSRRADAPLPA